MKTATLYFFSIFVSNQKMKMKNFICSILGLFVISIAQAQLKEITYKDGTQKLNGLYFTANKSNNDNAGILILPAWKGIDLHAKNSAEKLANLGYHTFVADIYGDGNYPTDTQQAAERAGFYKKNYEQYQTRIRLALAQLIQAGANPDKIVIMGYCFGGTGALEAARGALPVKGVVSFHGGLGKDATRITQSLNTKILVCHGADDPYESQDEITAFQKEMRDAKADWQMIYYANAVHAFTDPNAGNNNAKGAAYNEKAAQRSWEHLLVFLKEVL